MAIPVFMISGFLGSGKTTLLNHMLKNVPKELKVAIIVNEFGDISIDGRIIEHEGYTVKEITNGCICCTLRWELTRGLVDIAYDIKPDLIILETTGLSIPEDIARDMKAEQLRDKVECREVIILLNAPTYLAAQEKHIIVNMQMVGATKIVLNKIDLTDEDLLERTKRRINEIRPKDASLIMAKYGGIDIGAAFPGLGEIAAIQGKRGSAPGGIRPDVHQEEHDHDPRGGADDFTSLSFKTDIVVRFSDIVDFFKRNGERIVRAKGVVRTEIGNELIQFSSNGLDVSGYGKASEGTELVLITLKVDEEKVREETDRLFRPSG
jgi:G3E family GTPase